MCFPLQSPMQRIARLKAMSHGQGPATDGASQKSAAPRSSAAPTLCHQPFTSTPVYCARSTLLAQEIDLEMQSRGTSKKQIQSIRKHCSQSCRKQQQSTLESLKNNFVAKMFLQHLLYDGLVLKPPGVWISVQKSLQTKTWKQAPKQMEIQPTIPNKTFKIDTKCWKSDSGSPGVLPAAPMVTQDAPKCQNYNQRHWDGCPRRPIWQLWV